MKNAIETWKWSLGVVARSPVALLALAVIAAVWGFGAYEWLWLPESSGLLLFLALIWAFAQIVVAVAFFTASATAAVGTTRNGATRLRLQSMVSFTRSQFCRSLAWSLISVVLLLLLSHFFKWCDSHALEVASFLTFRSEQAVSPITIGKIFWVIQKLIWIIVGGFLLSALVGLLDKGWGEVRQQAVRLLGRCCWRAPFWSGLLSAVVFGGLAWLLATWHPKVPVGTWDYVQMLFRMGIALSLVVCGWLFWVLSLARLSFPREQTPAS